VYVLHIKTNLGSCCLVYRVVYVVRMKFLLWALKHA